MTTKIAKETADQMLGRLDHVASTIQENHEKWGMPFEAARSLVNALDMTADEIETATYGEESLRTRQIEVVTGTKVAQVIQREPDEKFMDTFKDPMAPIQIEADEPYMKAYADDQSSAVIHGQSTSGRKLAPGH